jgi:assimilatory nitrate reductase catalytic subunit
MSRTGTVAGLFAHEPEPRLGMHPDDLSALGCEDLELVKVSSRRGDVYVSVAADPSLRPGLVYMPMHWGARFLGGEGRHGVNELTIGALDPSSKQPELKHCAVRVLPAKLPWRLVAFGGVDEVSALFEQLTPFMTAVPFAARTLIGRERTGVRLVLAAETAPSQRVLAGIDEAFGLGAAEVVKYDEASVSRRVAFQDDRVRAVRVSGNVRSERWLRDLWLRDAPMGELRRYLRLAADPPLDAAMSRGRTLCNCFDVGETEIDAFLATRRSLDELQRQLKCGTNCGSCLPELRSKIDACMASAV